MAHIQRPFDEEDPTALIPVERRTEDDLPERVKGIVLWKTNLPDRRPGYYIYDVQNNTHSSVEFIEDHWYWLYDHNDFTFVSLQDRIEHYTFGTGYWSVEVDPQHPQHHIRKFAKLLSEMIRPDHVHHGHHVHLVWLGLISFGSGADVNHFGSRVNSHGPE